MCFAVWLTLPRVCVPAFVIEVLVSFMLGREASNTDSLSPSAVSVWPATLWSITTSSPTSSSSSSSSAAAHWLPRIQSEPTPSGTMWVYIVRSEVTHRGLSTFGDTLYLFIQITPEFLFLFELPSNLWGVHTDNISITCLIFSFKLVILSDTIFTSTTLSCLHRGWSVWIHLRCFWPPANTIYLFLLWVISQLSPFINNRPYI